MVFGDIIKSFASPALNPGGITFDGKNLLVCCGGDGRIHEIDRQIGSSIRSFPYIAFLLGLEMMENTLLQSDGTNIIYITDMLGNRIRTLPGIETFIYGLTWMGGGMIIQTAYNAGTGRNSYLSFRERGSSWTRVRRVDTNVGLLGICFDGKDIYGVEYDPANRIVKISIDGNIINSVAFLTRPRGITFDGKNLWVTNDTTDLIYCVSAS